MYSNNSCGTKETKSVAFPTSSLKFLSSTLDFTGYYKKRMYGLESKMVFLSVGMLVCVRV